MWESECAGSLTSGEISGIQSRSRLELEGDQSLAQAGVLLWFHWETKNVYSLYREIIPLGSSSFGRFTHKELPVLANASWKPAMKYLPHSVPPQFCSSAVHEINTRARALSPTPCSRILSDKLTVPELVKKTVSSCGTQWFVTVFTTALRLSCSWAKWRKPQIIPFGIASLQAGIRTRYPSATKQVC